MRCTCMRRRRFRPRRLADGGVRRATVPCLNDLLFLGPTENPSDDSEVSLLDKLVSVPYILMPCPQTSRRIA